MATTLRVGGDLPQFVSTISITPSAVSATSVSKETFTMNGANVDTFYQVDAPSLESGLFVLGARCLTVNVIEITFYNPTNATITPAAQVFRVIGE